ncbi:TetR/AcrR family transcriptional regulator [uncultured Eudoraea sp.]|uniref:TetR/AcrR family transcriptional regulator n=1 Tax=uncultured Eudoraea sp. TaxID=1035614 RepID=UPI0026156D2A|nr:TetR/AcrR family transcriptional regulator [uncultured Eudoraea sp.]
MKVKARILNIAKQKFLKYGFYKVSMDSLVKELRTSKSSLYNHYASKEDLVKAVIESLNLEINSKLEKILSDDRLSFKGKLIAVSEFTKDILVSVSEDFLRDLQINTPEIWEYYQKTRMERINKYYRSLFELGAKEGKVRNDISIDLILAVYLNLMELPLKSEHISFLNMQNQNVYEDTTEVFLNGIITS